MRRFVIYSVQAVIGFAAVFPMIVQAGRLSETTGWVAAGLAVSGAVNRLMAVPWVCQALGRAGMCADAGEERTETPGD